MQKHSPLFRLVSFLAIIGMIHLSTSCNYYKYTTEESPALGLHKIKPYDYIIVHFQTSVWHLSQLNIDQDQQLISGLKADVTPIHQGHIAPKPKANRYKKQTESPTNEIHLYIDGYQENSDRTISIPITSINRLDIYDKDVGATTASYVLGTMAIASGVFIIITIIALLTKSSCPFVYIHNGDSYQFYGEIYGGAISQNMERDDYMPLPGFEPQNGIYDLKITNELKERQYTDIAELILIEHAEDLKVMLDTEGNLHTLRELIAPASATTEKGTDLLQALSAEDSASYLYLDSDTTNPDFSSVHLQFPKPPKAVQAKLLIHAKNTLWLDYIFGEFNAQFGNKYDDFAEKQKTVPAAQKRQWTINEGMLLAVKMKVDTGWVVIDHLNMVGPLAPRSLLIPIDLKDHAGDILEIRLESGLHFWELDYAAIDYSEDVSLTQTHIQASYGLDEKGEDVLAPLAKIDGEYLTQLEVGNQAYLHFDAPQKQSPDHNFSVFLHTRGYYEYIRDFQGRPQVAKLKKFREKGTFARYSSDQLHQIINLQK